MRKFFNKLDLKVEAPLMWTKFCGAQNRTEWTNTDRTLEETKTHTVDTTDVSINTDITIPLEKELIFSIIWREIDANVPFTATVKVKGFADRSKTNRSVEKMARVDEEGVTALQRYAAFKGKIISTVAEFAFACIHGNLKVKGAINGELKMSTKNL